MGNGTPKRSRLPGAILIGIAAAFAGPSGAVEKGLDFPSNGDTRADVRFMFSGASLQPMYPATYVWRVKLRRQSGYYTTFFWGPNGAFTGYSYYGAHPYPDGDPKPSSRAHKWELSIDGKDVVTDANGHSTQLGYDEWRTQALRAFDNGANKVHEFYWDLPDTTKVIRVPMHREYDKPVPASPALTFGDAPWSLGNERLSGLLRGLQLYAADLAPREILAEIQAPLSTPAGKSGIWYLCLDPQPGDIADRSGKGHHPTWLSDARAAAWTSEGVFLPKGRGRTGKAAAAPLPILLVTALGRVVTEGGPASAPVFPFPFPGTPASSPE